ncbi:MAG: LysM peptidoglycan-binding domain-containing protein [Planctomycetes bacterium]|nr:LysM peptidoglycan-binding domain-containing protein [Planctomycetota bacterium]
MREEQPWKLVAVSLTALVLAAPIRADIIPRGQRSLRHEIVLEGGLLLPNLFRLYLVKEGDTLSKIALAELGEVSRLGEIRAEKGVLVPDQIKPGQRLILPPRQPVKNAEGQIVTRGYHPFYWPGFFGQAPIRAPLGVPLGSAYHSYCFVLVPDEVLDTFLAVIHPEPPPDRRHVDVDYETWMAVKGVVGSARIGNARYVSQHSSIQTRRSIHTLKGPEAGVLVLETKIENRDEDGELVWGAGWLGTAPPHLALVGLGVLGLVVMRRRRRAASA